MRRLCFIFMLITLNINIIYGEDEIAANKTKLASVSLEKIVAPGVLFPKTESPAVVVISERTLAELESSVAVKKAQNLTAAIELQQNKTANVIIGANATATEKAAENKVITNPTSLTNAEKTPESPAVTKHNVTKTENSQENNKDGPKPLPSISVEKNQATTISESSQSDADQVEYQQVLKRIDADIEGSVQTGFYILMGISVGALLVVCLKMNKLRLTRAERKYGVQGNRTNQELAPLPLSMEDPDSDEEDQTLFDRQQIRIF